MLDRAGGIDTAALLRGGVTAHRAISDDTAAVDATPVTEVSRIAADGAVANGNRAINPAAIATHVATDGAVGNCTVAVDATALVQTRVASDCAVGNCNRAINAINATAIATEGTTLLPAHVAGDDAVVDDQCSAVGDPATAAGKVSNLMSLVVADCAVTDHQHSITRDAARPFVGRVATNSALRNC